MMPFRQLWHEISHGYPTLHVPSGPEGPSYTLEWVCPCGAIVNRTYLPPNVRLLARMEEAKSRQPGSQPRGDTPEPQGQTSSREPHHEKGTKRECDAAE